MSEEKNVACPYMRVKYCTWEGENLEKRPCNLCMLGKIEKHLFRLNNAMRSSKSGKEK